MPKCLRLLDPGKTVFLLCDVQEAFRKALPLFGNLVKNTAKLLQAGKEFDVPLLVTEQYPEKLGKTVKELDVSRACLVAPKTCFSMVPAIEPTWKEMYKDGLNDAVLFGLESHVCVEQTAIDLRERDINVHLVTDCCASRSNTDRNFAFSRMRDAGCFLFTSEGIIFNLLASKDHPKFNAIQKLVKDPSADMQLVK